jgi:hypothetical protein
MEVLELRRLDRGTQAGTREKVLWYSASGRDQGLINLQSFLFRFRGCMARYEREMNEDKSDNAVADAGTDLYHQQTISIYSIVYYSKDIYLYVYASIQT